jgi:hypothetical protein
VARKADLGSSERTWPFSGSRRSAQAEGDGAWQVGAERPEQGRGGAGVWRGGLPGQSRAGGRGRRPPYEAASEPGGLPSRASGSGDKQGPQPDYVQWLVATKATRPRTRPGDTSKSSAKGLSPRAKKLQCVKRTALFHGAAGNHLLRSGAEAYSYTADACGGGSSRSGMDSDLEAFSHNPADGSFAAMPGRTAAKTNYLKPRFLSY